jgi:hypothetical protein
MGDTGRAALISAALVDAQVALAWNPWHRDFMRANELATEIVNLPVIGS